MKTIIEHIGEVVSKAFEECGYDASYATRKNWVKYLSLTDLIYVNISAMVRWRQQKHTRKHHL